MELHKRYLTHLNYAEALEPTRALERETFENPENPAVKPVKPCSSCFTTRFWGFAQMVVMRKTGCSRKRAGREEIGEDAPEPIAQRTGGVEPCRKYS